MRSIGLILIHGFRNLPKARQCCGESLPPPTRANQPTPCTGSSRLHNVPQQHPADSARFSQRRTHSGYRTPGRALSVRLWFPIRIQPPERFFETVDRINAAKQDRRELLDIERLPHCTPRAVALNVSSGTAVRARQPPFQTRTLEIS
jgi:hypothetical protein